MKKTLFITILLAAIQQVVSQTNITGGIVEGTWTKSSAPYLIQGSILIPNSKSLTIEPGVKIEFQGNYKLLVLGRINAVGNINDSITFTAKTPSIGWLGIRFENTSNLNDTSYFSYCKFEYGKANSTAPQNNGGAFYLKRYSKVDISNSQIENCYANANGGAIYCDKQSTPSIINCLIKNCYANANGGAIFCDNGSSPIITDNRIKNNTAKQRGGGIYSGASCSPIIENNIITSNTAVQISGAGIYHYDFGGPGSPSIKNNIITYNIGINADAGGIRVLSKSAVIMNNLIAYNEANSNIGGGGIYIGKIGNGGTGNIISHNRILNNKSSGEENEYGGGGIFCTSYDNGDVISNNLIANNSCSENGGGIYLSGASPTMFNNTIVNNSSRYGAGIFLKKGSSPEINNSIIWGNVAADSGDLIYINDEASDPNIYYTNIENGLSGIQSNSNTFYIGNYLNNLNSAPLFKKPSVGVGPNFDSLKSDWSLSTVPQSPCINQVYPTAKTSLFDIAGNPRIQNDLIDMGCYETLEINLSSNKINENEFLSFYPNPSKTTVNLNRNCNDVVIYNTKGKVAKKISKQKIKSIDVSDLDAGVYLIKLNNSSLHRFVKI